MLRSFQEEYPSIPSSQIEAWNIQDPWDNPGAYATCVAAVEAELNAMVVRLEDASS